MRARAALLAVLAAVVGVASARRQPGPAGSSADLNAQWYTWHQHLRVVPTVPRGAIHPLRGPLGALPEPRALVGYLPITSAAPTNPFAGPATAPRLYGYPGEPAPHQPAPPGGISPYPHQPCTQQLCVPPLVDVP